MLHGVDIDEPFHSAVRRRPPAEGAQVVVRDRHRSVDEARPRASGSTARAATSTCASRASTRSASSSPRRWAEALPRTRRRAHDMTVRQAFEPSCVRTCGWRTRAPVGPSSLSTQTSVIASTRGEMKHWRRVPRSYGTSARNAPLVAARSSSLWAGEATTPLLADSNTDASEAVGPGRAWHQDSQCPRRTQPTRRWCETVARRWLRTTASRAPTKSSKPGASPGSRSSSEASGRPGYA